MARIVVVLICGALVFVLVSKLAPHFLETYLPSLSAGSSPEKTEISKSTSDKKKTSAPKRKSGGSARSSEIEPGIPEASENVTAADAKGTAGLVKQAPPADLTPVARVTAENATLYLTNTSVGPVVGRLTKGALVEPVFVVNSGGQNWTFVNANNREIAGFVRSETLAKMKASDQPSR